MPTEEVRIAPHVLSSGHTSIGKIPQAKRYYEALVQKNLLVNGKLIACGAV